MPRAFVVAVAMLAGAGVARAQPQRTGAPPRATLYVERTAGQMIKARPVLEGLEAALGKRTEYSFVRLPELLEPVGDADKLLEQSAAAAAKGRSQLENLEVAEGTASLERAVTLAQAALPRLTGMTGGMNRMAGLLLELAYAHHLAGSKERCEQAISSAFIVDPGLELDANKYPPELRRIFESTRFLLDELGTGSLRLSTTPAGAAVRVNGSLVGYGPVTVPSLVAGPNLITVSQPGYRTVTRTITVEGRKQHQVAIVLSEHAGHVAGLLHAALEEARADTPGAWLPQAASRLQRDVLILGTLAVQGDVVAVSLHVYDASARKIAGQIRSTVTFQDADRECDTLVASLLANLGRPPTVEKRSTGRRGSFRGALVRFYRSRYFWPVVGGVAGAAVIGVGVGLGVYYGTRNNDREHRFVILGF
jgi:hypothetical protein